MSLVATGFKTPRQYLLLLTMTVVVIGCAPDAKPPEQSEAYTVIKIRDGDSITVRANGVPLEVRLFGIDAPEFNQPYAKESRRQTEQLLNGKQVMLKIIDKDRFGRTVAKVFLTGELESVNSQLVERGAAWVYRQYTNDSQLIDLEKQAKKQGIGLWAAQEEDIIPPWEWRQRRKQ